MKIVTNIPDSITYDILGLTSEQLVYIFGAIAGSNSFAVNDSLFPYNLKVPKHTTAGVDLFELIKEKLGV